jgi:hypothetical protein
MYNLADDSSKNVIVLVNDYYEEYGRAVHRLAEYLGRPLRGIMLIDKRLKEAGQNLPDTSGEFEEVICEFSNDAELRATVKRFEHELLVVTCGGESSQMDFQRVLPHVPYVLGPSERSIEWATHKGKMREIMGAYDPRLVPKLLTVADASEKQIDMVIESLTFPMMVKPTGLSDSTLVTKVHTKQELGRALRDSFAALEDTYKRNRGNGKPGILVEEFMEGDLYSIDGYASQSGQVWLLPLLRSKSAYHVGLPGFYIYQTETYHELTEEEDRAGKQVAQAAIHAVGLRSSVAHIELYKTADGWKVIELAARPGALRQEVYEASYGVDHALNELLLKIGLEPQLSAGRRTHSMVFKVYPEVEGEIVSIEGITEARHNPATYTINEFVKPGDHVLPITEGGSVAVQGVLCGLDVDALRKDVSATRAGIKIHIRAHEQKPTASIDQGRTLQVAA